MRDIRFRAWDKKNNRMLRVCSMSHGLMQGQTGWFITGEWTTPRPGGHSMVIKGETVYDYIVDQYRLDIVEHILTQFTGLHDKNGKEIYEGDITNNGVVVWNEALTWDSGGSSHPGFYFDAPRFDGDLNYHTSFDDDTEVIGNIYENPELLKEK